MGSQSPTNIEQLAVGSEMDSLVSTAVQQKAKEKQIMDSLMETYTKSFYKSSPPRPPPQTYAQVAQPRAHRSSSIKTVTSWPELPEQNRFDEKRYTHPYDRGMSDFPALPSPIERPFTNSPPRQESPFGLHMPEVLDVKSLQEEVRKHPEYVFDSILQIVEDLDAARSENESLKNEIEDLNQENEALSQENAGLKNNWMDVRHQTLDFHRQLTSTQLELANTQRELEKTREDLKAELEEHSQRRLDWNNRVQGYEELIAIGSAKQVILWKFIERIQKGTVSEGESDLEKAVPPMTGTKKTIVPRRFDTPKLTMPPKPGSTVTDYPGSPDKMFNPAASAFVPGAASPTKSAVSMISTPELPRVDILSCILTLPPRFYGICPNSLCASTNYRCKVPTCRLQHVCEAFNDEKGDGCHDRACKFVHEYRSCHEEIDGWGCRFANVNPDSRLRRAHMRKKVHEHLTTSEEWGARVIIAGLRIAHQEGKY